MKTSPNVAVVILDTLRYDAYNRHFDWLKNRSVNFENAWSTSHWTVPSHAGLFTGRYAREVGTHAKNRHLVYNNPTLVEMLSEAGYRTRGITANGSVTSEFNFDRGFDYLRYLPISSYINHNSKTSLLPFVNNILNSSDPTADVIRMVLGSRISKYHSGVESNKLYELMSKATLSGDSGARSILNHISKMNFSDNEFLYLNLMEVHEPYDPPVEYLTGEAIYFSNTFKRCALEGSNQDHSEIRRGYENSVAYLSDIYKKIHNELINDFDFIFTLSDHGESHGEHGNWAHTVGLNPEVTHIPLSITCKEKDVIKDTTQPVNILDVYNTVCDLTNVESDPKSRGKSLANKIPSREVFFETHGLLNKVLDSAKKDEDIAAETIELYEKPRFGIATKKSYAFQTHNGKLITQGPQNSFEKLINKYNDNLPESTVTEDHEVSESMERHLEYLGYS